MNAVIFDSVGIDAQIRGVRPDVALSDFGGFLHHLAKLARERDLALAFDERRLDLEHVTADLRWEKYCTLPANDKVLRELFGANKEMVDGTMVQARHILLTPGN